jgi:hypothetical protein
VAHEIAAVRGGVARRAEHCCEYCRIHEADAGYSHQVDHVISRKHGGSSEIDNLAYACFLCNRHKGPDIASVDPQTGKIVRLFNPRTDKWGDHFRIDGEMVRSLSGVAQVTIRLLRINAPERLAERRIMQRLGRYPLA